MLKAQYTQRGPNPVAFIEAVPLTLPDLGPGQARVEVLAAPINPSDVLTLTGLYGILPDLPAIGGNEGVGRIVECAPDVDSHRVGQRVLLPLGCGTWVSELITEAASLIPLPKDADPIQLSMIMVNPPTASLLLSEFADLKPGDWVIQNAANSAVGNYINQLARARDLQVINVVRRESAFDAVRRAGGEHLLCDGEDLASQVRSLVGKGRLPLGIDAVGGVATDHLADSLSQGGTVVNYGMMSGEPCQMSPRSLVFRDISLKGFWLAMWFRQSSPEAQQALYGDLAGRIASGELSAQVQATYGLGQIKAAVAAAASGERDGKIVITPQQG